jgi:N-acetylglucosaminyldiphosphoundecaprenol N-acetyl-beta-D-mannosaminyltransferase
MKRIDLMGVKIDVLTEAGLIGHVAEALARGQGGWVVTANLDILRRAVRDGAFAEMVKEAEVVVADGMPLVWASRMRGTPLPERVAGSTLVLTLAKALAAAGRSLFLLGGAPGAAEGAAQALQAGAPDLRIVGMYCPPVGFEDDKEEVRRLREAVVAVRPDVVYVALGSPKQERLIRALRGELPGAWWLGVGISLGFLSGQVQRAPRWVQAVGLEWVHRLVQEPRRLARRYLVDGIPFAVRLLATAWIERVRGIQRKVRVKE